MKKVLMVGLALLVSVAFVTAVFAQAPAKPAEKPAAAPEKAPAPAPKAPAPEKKAPAEKKEAAPKAKVHQRVCPYEMQRLRPYPEGHP